MRCPMQAERSCHRYRQAQQGDRVWERSCVRSPTCVPLEPRPILPLTRPAPTLSPSCTSRMLPPGPSPSCLPQLHSGPSCPPVAWTTTLRLSPRQLLTPRPRLSRNWRSPGGSTTLRLSPRQLHSPPHHLTARPRPPRGSRPLTSHHVRPPATSHRAQPPTTNPLSTAASSPPRSPVPLTRLARCFAARRNVRRASRSAAGPQPPSRPSQLGMASRKPLLP